MVFVTVGNEHAPDLLLVGNQIGKIGDHQVYTVHIFVGESHAAVDDDHVFTVFHNGAVLANLIQAAQGDNFQFFCQK